MLCRDELVRPCGNEVLLVRLLVMKGSVKVDHRRGPCEWEHHLENWPSKSEEEGEQEEKIESSWRLVTSVAVTSSMLVCMGASMAAVC